MFTKRRSTSGNSTMASGKRLQLWTVSVFFLLMTLATSESLPDDDDYDEWEPCRKWILSGGLASVKSDINPKDRVENIPSAEVSGWIRDDKDYGYSSEDEEVGNINPSGQEALRLGWPQLLRSRHREATIPEPRKRSRTCLKKCYEQRQLHPLQCHTLC